MWEQIAGLGLGLGADLLEKAFGPKLDDGGGTSMSESLGGVGAGSNPYEASLKAQEQLQKKIPGLMNTLNYNAMGQSGDKARMGAQIALEDWGNTNKATNAAAAMDSDANKLRTLGLSTGQQVIQNQQSQNRANTSSIIEALRNTGASPGAIASVAAKMGTSVGDSNQQLMASAMGAVSGNLAQASNLNAQAQSVLNADKQTEYNKVTPYLNQMQSLEGALGQINNAGTGAAQSMSVSQDTTTRNQKKGEFQGIQALLGKFASDAGEYGMYKELFGQPKPAQPAQPIN